MLNVIKFMSAMALAVFSASVFANPVAGNTCGEPDRQATVDLAIQCAYAPTTTAPIYDPNGTLSAADIAYFYGDTWENAGSLTANGTNGFFSATSNAGWGAIPNSGTWAIDSSFWAQFDKAVISIHVGSGQFAPDNWAFLMLDGALSGNWSLDLINLDATGGGLSNIKLWGVRGETVPEPGIVALLAVGLLGMVVVRRKKTV